MSDNDTEKNSRRLTGTLEQWSTLGWSGSSVVGNIFGDIHGRFPDGSMITTSAVVKWHYDNAGSPVLIETRNSVYALGRAYSSDG